MDEGYIEVDSKGMRLFSVGFISITTKHFVSTFLGALAFLPIGILAAIVGLLVPGPAFLPLLFGILGLLPGVILAVIPAPKKQTNLLIWFYRKAKFRYRTQVFVFDREFRTRRNFETISTWMNEVMRAAQDDRGGTA